MCAHIHFTAELFELLLYLKVEGFSSKSFAGGEVRYKRTLAKGILMNESWRNCSNTNILIPVFFKKYDNILQLLYCHCFLLNHIFNLYQVTCEI